MKTDRDLSIERLLRRSLKSRPGPFGPGFTGGSERTRPTTSDCPDVEALAALADHTLSAAERQIVDAHVADCHRCQSLTAAMVRTTTAEKGVGSLFGGDISKRLPTPLSRSTLNWFIPATAAAAAVLLWVTVPGQRSPAPEERQQAAQTAPAAPLEPSDARGADAFRSPSGERADNQARGNEKDTALGSTTSATAQPAAAPAEVLRERDQDRFAREERGASTQERVAAEPNRSLDQVAPLASARAAAPAAVGLEVASSDPLIRWRIGPGAVVQYSADGGSTWTTQETGATLPLTAGSSPSPSVCWLVGRAGTVLRSVDGGRQWQRVAFPEAEDLVAVRASDALTATVDLAGGRRLRTTDGGQTWGAVSE